MTGPGSFSLAGFEVTTIGRIWGDHRGTDPWPPHEIQTTDRERTGRSAWLKGEKKLPESSEAGTPEKPRPRFSRARFESTPDFAEFKEGVKTAPSRAEGTLGRIREKMKESSSRRDNPNAPERKKKRNG